MPRVFHPPNLLPKLSPGEDNKRSFHYPLGPLMRSPCQQNQLTQQRKKLGGPQEEAVGEAEAEELMEGEGEMQMVLLRLLMVQQPVPRLLRDEERVDKAEDHFVEEVEVEDHPAEVQEKEKDLEMRNLKLLPKPERLAAMNESLDFATVDRRILVVR